MNSRIAVGPSRRSPWRRPTDSSRNVLGLIATRAVDFRANRGGTIVNVSSMGGRVTFPLGALYHSTKFAVEAAEDVR